MYAILHIPTGTYLKKIIVNSKYQDNFQIALSPNKNRLKYALNAFIRSPEYCELWIEDQINNMEDTSDYTYAIEEFEIVEVE